MQSSRRGHGDNIASMAWNLHAIEQAQLRKHVVSMAWGARDSIPHRSQLDLVARLEAPRSKNLEGLVVVVKV